METDKMSMYSVWVDTSEKVASFHMVESGDFIHFPATGRLHGLSQHTHHTRLSIPINHFHPLNLL